MPRISCDDGLIHHLRYWGSLDKMLEQILHSSCNIFGRWIDAGFVSTQHVRSERRYLRPDAESPHDWLEQLGLTSGPFRLERQVDERKGAPHFFITDVRRSPDSGSRSLTCVRRVLIVPVDLIPNPLNTRVYIVTTTWRFFSGGTCADAIEQRHRRLLLGAQGCMTTRAFDQIDQLVGHRLETLQRPPLPFASQWRCGSQRQC
ncbi:hypothetical protein [Xanthomonas campestris]|uniref:hypothetical protein n=1 Tax=Xanthomonas campestris TaxID=339 RepID=UPI0011AFC6C2|nr:hypothetical protein [Xanthomonas campestris]MDM7587117.1 hypothetical protein [Xanthomonas campestris]MDM7594217.1 hypothetical protein [Xanthomonas campestris]MEA0763134.1 hypothetical protein [Xanthomonas campestris pv. campestris]MEA9866394.1 hypothetical protein [Xanthomonas campestris pv. raphani]MEB1225019.1 hypothetical protein [Xanthomonas campestris pv. campestris]